jgi:hypothetical protein
MKTSKGIKITGWVLTGLIAAALIMSAFMKISLHEMVVEQAGKAGVEPSTFRMIGIVELLSVILFVIPRTGIVGTVLLVAYFGGAISSHVFGHQPLGTVIGFEVEICLTAILRFPEITQRLIKGNK